MIEIVVNFHMVFLQRYVTIRDNICVDTPTISGYAHRDWKGFQMTARLQRGTTPASCVTSTGMPAQNAASILKLLVPNLHSTPFTHGVAAARPQQCTQHLYTYVALVKFMLPPNFIFVAEASPYSLQFTLKKCCFKYVHLHRMTTPKITPNANATTSLIG